MKEFADQNLLMLNVSQCEIVLFSSQHSIPAPICMVDSLVISTGDMGRCIGYQWKGDLSASRSVKENVQKAR